MPSCLLSLGCDQLWLDPEEVAKITKAQTEKEDAAKKKKAEKTAKKKAKKQAKEEEMEAAKLLPSTKKGIAKKSIEPVDEVTQAAAQMSQMEGDEDLNLEDLGFDFEGDDPFAGMNLDQIS